MGRPRFLTFRHASNPNIWSCVDPWRAGSVSWPLLRVTVAIAHCQKLDVMPTADQRFKMKWWGWGSEQVRKELPHSAATRDYLRARLGVERFEPRSRIRLESLRLPESRVDQALLGAAERDRRARRIAAPIIASGRCTRSARVTRICCASASSCSSGATDVVVYPRSEAEVAAVLACCREAASRRRAFRRRNQRGRRGRAGSGPQRVVVTLDLALLNRVLAIDEVSQTATVEAGIFGPELESRLAERGFTLGHYPQSFEFSTLGGWIATRSSGQNSLAYGGIEKLVESLRVVTPQGTVETLHVPRRADGPDVGQMLIGSEGIYGVIVSATVRIRRRRPSATISCTRSRTLPTASPSPAQLVQSGAAPALVASLRRRGDGRVARAGQSRRGDRMAKCRPADRAKSHRVAARTAGIRPPAMSTLLVGLEGTLDENRRQRRLVHAALRGRRCVNPGADAGSGAGWPRDSICPTSATS